MEEENQVVQLSNQSVIEHINLKINLKILQLDKMTSRSLEALDEFLETVPTNLE